MNILFITFIFSTISFSILTTTTHAKNHKNSSSTKDHTEETMSYPLSKKGSLEIENVNGSITINGDKDEDSVSITVEKKGDKSDFSKVQTTVDSQKSHLSIKTIYPKEHCNVSVRYTITCPQSIAIKSATTVHGSITVNHIDNDVTTHTVNGSVTIRNCAGKIDATTTDGSVFIEKSTGPVVSKTTNGRISVEESSHNVAANVTNGAVHCSIESIENKRISLTTTNGSINCEIPENCNSRISAKTISSNIKTNIKNATFDKQPGQRSMKATTGNDNSADAKSPSTITCQTTNGSINIVTKEK